MKFLDLTSKSKSLFKSIVVACLLLSGPGQSQARTLTERQLNPCGIPFCSFAPAATNDNLASLQRLVDVNQQPQDPGRQSKESVGVLTLGQPIEGELTGGQARSYQVRATPGQYLSVAVDQRGIDVTVTLFGPDGKKISEVDGLNGMFGPEVVLAITETAGEYRVEMRSSNAKATAGKYEIKIQELRAATEEDKNRVATVTSARQYLTEIGTLVRKGDAESFKAALPKSEQAVILWRQVGDQDSEAYTLEFIGVLHQVLGEKKEALQSLNQALPLSRATTNRRLEAAILGDIGDVYNELGEKKKALEYFNQALPIVRSVGDRSLESNLLNNIGGVHQSLEQWREALASFQQALPYRHESGDLKGEAETLTNLGLVLHSLGEKEKSLDVFKQVLPMHIKQANAAGEAVALYEIATLYDSLGDKQKALEVYGQALLKLRALGARGKEAATLLRMGLIHKSLGQKEKTLELYRQALPILRETGDKLDEATALFATGVVLDELGDWQKALEFFNQALPLFKEQGYRIGEAKALRDLGGIYKAHGEWQKALSFANQALVVFRAERDRSNEAQTLGDIGMLYRYLGEWQKALESHNLALQIRRELGDRSGEASALNNIGLVYNDLDDSLKAMDFYKQALRLDRASANKLGEASTLMNAASIAYSIRQWQMALNYYNEALATFRTLHDRQGEAAALSNMALVHEAQGQTQKALDTYNQALALSRALGNPSGEATTLGNLGVAYNALGDREKALAFLNQALSMHRKLGDADSEALVLVNLMSMWKERNPSLAIFYGKQAVNKYQQLRSNIKGLDKALQRTFLHSKEDTYRSLAELLISHGRFPEAQQVLGLLKEEEYFEFVRRDVGVGQLTSVRISFSPAEAELEKRFAEIADRIAEIGNQRGALLALKERTPEQEKRLSELEAQLETANQVFQKFVDQLEAELKQTGAGGNDVTALRESQALKDTLRELDAVALYTVVGREKYNVILITPDVEKAFEYKIGEADLNKKVFAFRENLQKPNSDARPQAQELYRILIGPELRRDIAQTRKQTILWSLDGALRYLPMAALHDGEKYLVESYQNVMITLASRDHLKDVVTPKWQVLGLGVSKGQVINAGPNDPLVFPPLPGVREELTGIVRDETGRGQSGVLPGKVMLDEEFTADAMKTALRLRGNEQPYKLVHIASHFNFHPGDETKSFLLLGGGKTLTLDQLKSMSQIFSRVELLTLSACNTATGDARASGKEVEGFAVLAQRQGAEAIIASLWPVSDPSTSQLMQQFYRLRDKDAGMSKAEAMRQAQLALLRGEAQGSAGNDKNGRGEPPEQNKSSVSNEPVFKTDPKARFAHPYFWAPFILIGNWR